ncbi:ASCH domain-containing protein [Kocuria palustris]|uniref:ASCH domain-containing protein n=1 Tax=Kocuria palustris TaxID=71999 RepID=UPI003D70E0BD
MPVQQQVIEFHPRHRAAVLNGTKTLTVRWNEAITVGAAWLAFDPAGREMLDGVVLKIQRFPLNKLTAAAVRAPENTDMVEYVRQLRENYYPSMPTDALLDVVHFRIQGPQHR